MIPLQPVPTPPGVRTRASVGARRAAAVAAALALLTAAPARGAEVAGEAGVSGGYTATSTRTDGASVDDTPYLSGWVSGIALFEPAPDLAPFLSLSYDAFVPLDPDGLPGHGPLATAGVVWLPSRRLALDASIWGMGRFFGGEAPVTVGLLGGALGGELTVWRRLGIQLSGWHVARFSDDPLLRGATTGGGPGLVWRPTKTVRLQASWGIEQGPAFLTDYGEAPLPVPTGTTPEDVWSQVLRAKLRVGIGGGFYVQPSYRLRLGEAAGGASYDLHSLQVAFGWRS